MEEERERVLLELLCVAALTADSDGQIRYVNRAAETAFGKDASELLGASLGETLLAAESTEPVAARLKQAASSGRSLIWKAVSGAKLLFRVVSLGDPERYVLLGTEDAPHPTARSTDRGLPTPSFLASILHEISNPLTYTLASLEVALRKIEELPEETLAPPFPTVLGYIRSAHEGAGRMQSIVKKVTTAEDSGVSWPAESELTLVLDHALLLAWNELRHAVTVIKRYTALPRVMGDQHVLTRAVAELLAIAGEEYRQAGSTELSLSVKRHGETASVEIVNERPVSGAHVWGTIDEGRLQFARDAISATGGNLRLTQRASGGQRCYELDLPLAEAARRSSPASSSAVRTLSARVLFIDDEALLAETLQLAFGSDHDVRAVTSAKGAIALLERDRDFDLILCDLMMPEQTGAAVFARIKELAPELAPRFVLMTGGAFTPATQKFLDEFQGLTLEKPFQVQDVEALIVQFLALRKRH